MPTQLSHVDLSAAGCVPAPQDSHADWPELATLPASSHAVHAIVPVLTLPAAHGVHSPASLQSAGLHTPFIMQEFPLGHVYGLTHLVPPLTMSCGGGQGLQMPTSEYCPSAQSTQAVLAEFAP